MKSKFRTASTIVVVSALALVGLRTFAMQEAHKGNDGLLKALSKAKVTLAQGIQQATKGSAMPISAKFEMDDKGQLSLSVYTADKGLDKSAEHNTLKELSGSPASAAWTPETEVFKDVEHVARASEQLTLMRLSSSSLVDIVKQAEKFGMVVSVAPVVERRQGRIEAFVVIDGKVVEKPFGLDGKPVGHGDKDDDDKD